MLRLLRRSYCSDSYQVRVVVALNIEFPGRPAGIFDPDIFPGQRPISVNSLSLLYNNYLYQWQEFSLGMHSCRRDRAAVYPTRTLPENFQINAIVRHPFHHFSWVIRNLNINSEVFGIVIGLPDGIECNSRCGVNDIFRLF